MIAFRAPAHSHGEVVEAAGRPVRLKVDPRARRISLRLDRVKGEIVATAPTLRRLSEAVAFARERADWIAAQFADLPEQTPLQPGLSFELFGAPCRLEAGAGRAKLLSSEDGVRIVAAHDAAFAVRALRLIKAEAGKVLTARTAHYAERIGRPAPKVTIVDPRGRWGSCKPATASAPASIRYSWRLALAPFAVADYVAAHESAHLIEANHGPRFWALVGDLVGDHRPHRQWLKTHSARLHAFGRG
jgi:predicted metal-dependent hydrolase